MKENIKKMLFSLILTGVFLLTSIVFVCIITSSGFLTGELLTFFSIVLLLFAGLVFLLSKDTKRKVRSVMAAILAAVIIVVEVLGSYFVLVGHDALKFITEPDTEHAEVGVYVRKDDAAETINDVKGYTFGRLSVQDKEITDFAFENISIEIGDIENIKEYENLGKLMDALLTSKEVDVVVVNEGMMDLLDEIEGHSKDEKNIRKIYKVVINTDIVPTTPAPSTPKDEKNENVFTVYISGIDSSGSVSVRSRSDVNILATVNIETGQILLVSTPRDYFVPLSISNGALDKLTHAGIYGVEVSKDTMEMIYDTEIDYYFKVNFDGFKEIIDALGGITVNSQFNFGNGIYNFVKGKNHLDGKAALSFARNRMSFANGDAQRGKHQMEVIRAVIEKATSPAIITNFKSVLDGVKGAFETNMPYEKITELIQNQLKNGTKWNVTSYSVYGTGGSDIPYSLGYYAYVLVPNRESVIKAEALMEQVKDGEVPTP